MQTRSPGLGPSRMPPPRIVAALAVTVALVAFVLLSGGGGDEEASEQSDAATSTTEVQQEEPDPLVSTTTIAPASGAVEIDESWNYKGISRYDDDGVLIASTRRGSDSPVTTSVGADPRTLPSDDDDGSDVGSSEAEPEGAIPAVPTTRAPQAPSGSTVEPPPTTKSPTSTTAKPPATTAKPPATTAKPPATTTKPPKTTTTAALQAASPGLDG